ncbi:MAG: hypothetical protein HQM11_02120 [SAR324 cluster bacterium]|nr:hypothetical protein [SAR324 cluster bacterium]
MSTKSFSEAKAMLNEISCEIEQEICVFHFMEDKVSVDTGVFIDKLKELFANYPIRGYILDMEKINFLPSMTIGFIFLLMREFGKPESPFVITGVNDMLGKVITMVGISKLCRQFPGVEEGLKHLSGQGGSFVPKINIKAEQPEPVAPAKVEAPVPPVKPEIKQEVKAEPPKPQKPISIPTPPPPPKQQSQPVRETTEEPEQTLESIQEELKNIFKGF